MVKIRLSLRGKKKQPYYHIVAVDSRNRRDGKVLDNLGSYNPRAAKDEEKVTIISERYKDWLSKGAQPSDTVLQILKFSSNS